MRYIDADELVVFGLDNPDDEHLFEFVPLEFINNAPTLDLVEVVRCRDCKYGSQFTNDKVWCSLGATSYRPNDFCSYGERKEDV